MRDDLILRTELINSLKIQISLKIAINAFLHLGYQLKNIPIFYSLKILQQNIHLTNSR